MEVVRFEMGPVLLTPKKFTDDRGFFSEVYNTRVFDDAIGEQVFVQDNHSLSIPAGTVRGLHFQTNPAAQGKLVRVIRGSIFDVAVDIRRNSRTFGKFISATLTADNWSQLWVPPGFAHGFCTLEPNTEAVYKVTSYYSKENDAGLAWDDPALGIPWPFKPDQALLSPKDRLLPKLAELTELF